MPHCALRTSVFDVLVLSVLKALEVKPVEFSLKFLGLFCGWEREKVLVYPRCSLLHTKVTRSKDTWQADFICVAPGTAWFFVPFRLAMVLGR